MSGSDLGQISPNIWTAPSGRFKQTFMLFDHMMVKRRLDLPKEFQPSWQFKYVQLSLPLPKYSGEPVISNARLNFETS